VEILRCLNDTEPVCSECLEDSTNICIAKNVSWLSMPPLAVPALTLLSGAAVSPHFELVVYDLFQAIRCYKSDKDRIRTYTPQPPEVMELCFSGCGVIRQACCVDLVPACLGDEDI